MLNWFPLSDLPLNGHRAFTDFLTLLLTGTLSGLLHVFSLLFPLLISKYLFNTAREAH